MPSYSYGMPPPPQPPKGKRRKWPWVVGIILVLLVIGSINAAISGGNGIGNQPDSTPTTASFRATSAPTQVAKPTQASQPTSAPVSGGNPANAILGGTLADFVARYGQLNSHSDPSKGEYYIALYGNDKNDLTLQFIYNKHTDGIILGAPDNKYWTYTEAKAECLRFLPSDAVYQRKMTVLDPQGNPMDEQLVYYSPSLGKLFPASAFNDENGNPAKPGTIGLILGHWTATSYIQCAVQVGLESK